MSDSLATWLNTETNRKGWTLRQVAIKAGVSHTTVYKIANNERTPRAETCNALAAVFDADAEEVLRFAGHLKTPSRKIGQVNDHKVVYRINTERGGLAARWKQAFESLNLDEQEFAVEFVERLAGKVKPRIIGEEAKE